MGQEQNQHRRSAILICSDRAYSGERPDATAPLLGEQLQNLGYRVEAVEIIPDNRGNIVEMLQQWIAAGIHLILISGGTGLAPSDVTPEATLEVIERRVPGMEEVMRRASLEVTPHGMLSRAVVGVAGESLIINLPGSPRGAVENFDAVKPGVDHAIALITGGKPDK
jgi:molybdenum cofactor synthesis domain-containing protein